jgi:hypothetical protein
LGGIDRSPAATFLQDNWPRLAKRSAVLTNRKWKTIRGVQHGSRDNPHEANLLREYIRPDRSLAQRLLNNVNTDDYSLNEPIYRLRRKEQMNDELLPWIWEDTWIDLGGEG